VADKSIASLSGKTIPSEHFGATLFLIDLTTQCHLFERASGRLEIYANNWIAGAGPNGGKKGARIEIVADCSICLSALAAIRRTLFPGSFLSSARQSVRTLRCRSAALVDKILFHV